MSGRGSDLAIYGRLLRHARSYWPHLVGIFLLSLLAAPLALLTPLPLKIAVDSAIGSRALPGFLGRLLPAGSAASPGAVLALAAGLMIAIALLLHLQGLAGSLLEAYTGEKMILGFRAQLFRHVQRVSLLYHDTRGTADSTYRIHYDAPYIKELTVNGVIPLLSSSLTVAGMVYVTARIDWQLSLVALTVCPLLVLVTRVFRRRSKTQWRALKTLDSSAMSVVQEALSALRVVKAFGGEDHEEGRFLRHSQQRVRGHLRLALFYGSFELLVGLILASGTAVTLYVGAGHVRSGSMSLGALLVVMAYLAQLYQPLRTLSKRLTDLQSGLASAERAFALLDEPPEVAERPGARRIARASGNTRFRDVSFSYTEHQPVLRGVSFEVAPCARVGIAGPTGAGKTTLVSLLTRFYDPTSGQITLDGIDLREYRLADLREQFALVLQEPVLFSTTIAENIAYGRPGASDEEIADAARLANAHDFIVRLPEGYQTQVGERGMLLSGGERQRISLARAFLKDAPILVLDEPTSSIDVGTEAVILEAMERLMQGRTSFMVSHRLGALRNCDLLLVIEDGRCRVSGAKLSLAPAT